MARRCVYGLFGSCRTNCVMRIARPGRRRVAWFAIFGQNTRSDKQSQAISIYSQPFELPLRRLCAASVPPRAAPRHSALHRATFPPPSCDLCAAFTLLRSAPRHLRSAAAVPSCRLRATFPSPNLRAGIPISPRAAPRPVRRCSAFIALSGAFAASALRLSSSLALSLRRCHVAVAEPFVLPSCGLFDEFSLHFVRTTELVKQHPSPEINAPARSSHYDTQPR